MRGRKQVFIALLLAALAAAAPGQVITSVVRTNGQSGDRDPIGVYDGNRDPLPTQAGGFQNGNYIFSDRTYTWANTPDVTIGSDEYPLIGSEYVRTFNSDKDAAASNVNYAVTISRKASLWITVDNRFADPQVVADTITAEFADPGTFQDSGVDVFVGGDSDRPLSIYTADFPAGTYDFSYQGSTSNNNFVIGAVPATTWGAVNPTPADGATGVPDEVITLSWEPSTEDTPPDPGIQEWRVYFGDTPDVGDPNLLVSEPYFYMAVPAGEPLAVDTPDLDNDTTYYWRVQAYVSDANTVFGDLWSFTTILALPQIEQQPQDQYIGPGGCEGTFSVEIRSTTGAVAYQWYQANGTPITGATDSTYSTGTPGEYYVEITNEIGTTQSETAVLTVVDYGELYQGMDIGTTGGSFESLPGGQYSVIADGADIWGAADQMHYVYTQRSGDFDISALVESVEGVPGATVNAWRKAGVMARETLAADSVNVAMLMAPGQPTATYQQRPTTGAGSTSSHVSTATTPQYVRIVREGDAFSGYFSANGTDWTLESTYTIDMPDTIYVGLAVTSHQTGNLVEGIFSEVVGMGASWQVMNPHYSPAPTPQGWVDPEQAVTLIWEKAPLGPCDATYEVFFGQAPDSLTSLGTTTALELEISQAMLQHDSTYFWRVDTAAGGITEMGNVWSFDTIKELPFIVTEPQDYWVVPVGSTLQVPFEAISYYDATLPITSIKWFKEGVAAPVQSTVDEETLVVSNIQPEDEGVYYAVITNATGSIETVRVRVVTERLIVHLPFDAPNPLENVASDFDATVFTGEPGLDPTQTDDAIVGSGAMEFFGAVDPNAAEGFVTLDKLAGELGITGNRPRTVSVWVKTDAFNNGGIWDIGDYADAQDFSLRTLTIANQWRVQYWGGANDHDFVTSMGVGFTMNENAAFISEDEWVHFVLVHTGAQTKIFGNGVQIIQLDRTLNTGDAWPLAVGAYHWLQDAETEEISAQAVFDGVIDDFRLYNYALSDAEVAKLYADVTGEPICLSEPAYDLNGDCRVDLEDYALLAAHWLESGQVEPQ